MNGWEAWLNSAALAIVAVAALLHIKAMRKRRPDCESVGFAIVFAAGVGAALEPWWAVLCAIFGAAGTAPAYLVTTLFHVGCALVAIAMVRGDLRELLGRAGRLLAQRRVNRLEESQ